MDRQLDQPSTVDSVFKASSSTFYYNVKAENGAGLLSADTSSDGQFEYNNTGIGYTPTMNVQVYPNPVKSTCYIKTNVDISAWTLLDQNGRLVQRRENISKNSQRIEINMGQLPEGTYFLLCYTTEKVHTIKLIKQ